MVLRAQSCLAAYCPVRNNDIVFGGIGAPLLGFEFGLEDSELSLNDLGRF